MESKGWAASVDTTLIDVAPATFKPTSKPTTILVTKAERNFMNIMMTVMLVKKLTFCDVISSENYRNILRSSKSKLKIKSICRLLITAILNYMGKNTLCASTQRMYQMPDAQKGE